MKMSFYEEFIPPKTTKQVSGRRSYDTPSVRHAKATWLAVFEKHKPVSPFLGPLRLNMVLTYPAPRKTQGRGVSVKAMGVRPDIDNLCKIIFDAMTKAGYWQDDSQIASLCIAKFQGGFPGISLTLGTWEESV